MRHPLTEIQIKQLKKLFNKDEYTDVYIAEKTGISVGVVRYHKKMMGFIGKQKSHYSRWHNHNIDEAIKIWNETHSMDALKDFLGMKESSIRTLFSDFRKLRDDVPYLTTKKKQTNRWTEETVREAKTLWRTTHDMQLMTERFQVKESTLRSQFCKLRSMGFDAPYLYRMTKKQ